MDDTLGYLYCSDIPGFVNLIGIYKQAAENVSSSSFAQRAWFRVEEIESLRSHDQEFKEVKLEPGSIVPLDKGSATQVHK